MNIYFIVSGLTSNFWQSQQKTRCGPHFLVRSSSRLSSVRKLSKTTHNSKQTASALKFSQQLICASSNCGSPFISMVVVTPLFRMCNCECSFVYGLIIALCCSNCLCFYHTAINRLQIYVAPCVVSESQAFCGSDYIDSRLFTVG